MLSGEKLMQMHERGLFPFPGEDDAAFEVRAATFLEGERTVSTFGLAVDWLKVEFSNQGLSFFEGGATWIGHYPKIQLREAFKKRRSWIGYTRDELLQHEAVHAMRSLFEEPRFEEMLAYSTSPRSWRRVLGPLFQSNRTGYVLIFSLLLPIIHPLLWTLPIALLSWMGVRLISDCAIFRKAEKIASKSVLLCMQDHEINSLGRGESLELGNSPRERLLKILLAK